MRQVGTRGSLVDMECMCFSHGLTNFSQAGVLGFCDSDGHVEPAVSVRLCLKTHESNNSLNLCPVVKEEMD